MSEQETLTYSLKDRAAALIAFLIGVFFQIWLPYSVYQNSGTYDAVVIGLIWFPILVLTSLWHLSVNVRPPGERANHNGET